MVLQLGLQYVWVGMPNLRKFVIIVELQVLGLGLGVDFTFALDNKNNKNPHLNILKGTVLGDKEQGVGIRNKGQRSRVKDQGQGSRDKT